MRKAGPTESLTFTERVKNPLRQLRYELRMLTGPLRGLPSALIIGVQRGGTTSLFNYLIRHPKVLSPLGKEIHYFDFQYARGTRYYRGRFPYARRLRGGSLTLDATPYYMMHPLAPERAAQLLPGVKLIAVLRNPIERAFSHYQHEVRGGRESLSFAEAIEQEPERLAGEEERMRREPGYYSWNHRRYSYLLRGLYLKQLLQWLEHFPRSQLLVIQSERLFKDPAATTSEVHRFLGLPAGGVDRYEDIFQQGNYVHDIPAELRSRLAAYFEPHNRELFRWLGQEYDWT
jgi:hypothetical protein